MFRLTRATVAWTALAVPTPAFAHGDAEHHAAPGWSLEPVILVPLFCLLLVFLIGRERVSRRSKVARPRGGWFLGGWLVLTLALISPLHEGGERSFTLHMAEHELIMLVATLMMAIGPVGGILAWGLPDRVRRALGGGWKAPLVTLWGRLTEPVIATVLQGVTLWAWHAPALFDRALQSAGWHAAQHLSFILTSLVFWRAMLGLRGGQELLGALCLFVTSLVEGALGALMALSTSSWYPRYAAMGLSGLGFDPVSDQQVAGLLMWIPGGLVHGAAALALLYRWLSRSGEHHAFGTK
jgi:cytochrome c oxidase assembly factor CtaG